MSDEDLTQVLMEFHQRNERERRPVGVPQPLEITTSVQTLHAIPQAPVRQVDTPELVNQSVGVAFDDEFDLFAHSVVGNTNTGLLYVYAYIRCHNKGKIGAKSWIGVYQGGPNNPPNWTGTSGGQTVAFAGAKMNVWFNQSTWQPPPLDAGYSILVEMICQPLQVPPPHGGAQIPATANFGIFLKRQDNNELSKQIYGQPTGLWKWYNSPNGVGFNVPFTY